MRKKKRKSYNTKQNLKNFNTKSKEIQRIKKDFKLISH